MLECEAHLTGNNVVEADQFRGIASAFDAKKDLTGVLVVVDGDRERALAGDFYFLGDVLTTGTERKPLAHDVSSSSEMTSGPALSSESESWLRLVADLRIFCRVLPPSAELSAGCTDYR
jgi:hypothetical protein